MGDNRMKQQKPHTQYLAFSPLSLSVFLMLFLFSPVDVRSDDADGVVTTIGGRMGGDLATVRG